MNIRCMKRAVVAIDATANRRKNLKTLNSLLCFVVVANGKSNVRATKQQNTAKHEQERDDTFLRFSPSFPPSIRSNAKWKKRQLFVRSRRIGVCSRCLSVGIEQERKKNKKKFYQIPPNIVRLELIPKKKSYKILW